MTWHVSTDIPHGNAALVEISELDGIPTVAFSAHPHGGTETLWWCFRLHRDATGESAKTVRLVWRHYTNCLGLSRNAPETMHPVIRRDGGTWERLPAGHVIENVNGLPAALWEIAAPEHRLEAAFCFPHGPEHVAAFAEASGWRHDAIGVSSAGRALIRVANAYGEAGADRPGIYCVAHQHASEMSGAWVLQGFLEEMARRGDAAPLVWAVPVVNIDGVIEGDYGKDPFPWDINRAWGRPPMRTEALACMRDIESWRTRCRPLACLDFHSPGGAEHAGMYTFLMDPQINPAAHEAGSEWADGIREEVGAFAAEDFKRFARHRGRFKTDRNSSFSKYYCQSPLLGMTFEVPYHRVGDRVLAVADYLEMGRRTAAAVCRKAGGG